MFLGTARTSVAGKTMWMCFVVRKTGQGQGRTALWHLHEEELLAFFWFGNVSRHKWILCARQGKRAFEGNRRGPRRTPHTMNVSKLGRHHWARQSPISQSLSIPWEALNWRESLGGAKRSSRRRLSPSSSSSPGFK